uniref:Wings apart-like protein C-terminal domain-containing protein n=1 Tax=Ganoderma boninense TaxID=34458 RepID=A0A5K1JVH0_9APHY|nr:Uncharacterized protein [Ganoderma boninense]
MDILPTCVVDKPKIPKSKRSTRSGTLTPPAHGSTFSTPLGRSFAHPVTSSVLLDESPSPHPPVSHPPAKDLSDIFSFATEDPVAGTSRSANKPPSSLARRMLGRSRTESSVISVSSTSEQDTSDPNSVPTTPKKLRPFVSEGVIGSPSSHSPSRAKSADDVSSPPVGPRPSLANANSNVRTYAGKSRSFLVALPPSQAASIGVDTTAATFDSAAMLADNQEDDFEIRESYTELRQRWGIDGSEDDPRPVSPHQSPSPRRKGKSTGLPKQHPVESVRLFNGMINDLKSITDLRSKGESRRFLDEVGYLFEGLEGSCTISVRRASALEIVTKLCDVDFARKAKAADFLGRAWEVLREAGAGDGDKVLDTSLAFYAALVARDSTVLSDLVLKSDFIDTLHNMLTPLELSNDPLWLISTNAGPTDLKASGISKAENLLLGNLQKLAQKKSGVFQDHDICLAGF